MRCCTCCGFAQVKLLISNDNEHHTSGDVLQKRSVGHLAQRRATGWGPPENIRDVTFGEDASRVSRAHQAKAAVRNTVIGILHLHQVPNIAAQLRACHRDPYRLPLQLLGLTAPLTMTRKWDLSWARGSTRRSVSGAG